MKVLLINPPTPAYVSDRDKSIPIGLLYLASNLMKSGYSVKISDINNDCLSLEAAGNEINLGQYLESQLPKEIEQFGPDLIGIGCPFSVRFNTALSACKIIKERFPQLPVVLGGLHPTMFSRELLVNCPNVDYVILGEGEESFVRLIMAHFQKQPEISKVGGVAFRQDKEVMVNEKDGFTQNLDELPFPAHNLIDLNNYYFDTSGWQNPKKLPINIAVPLITSRSCPNRCNFCSMFLVHGKKFRARSPKNVVDEIEWLYREYSQRYFSIMDDNFTLVKDRAIEIAAEITRRKLNLQFDAPNGLAINTLDKEVLDALVEMGLIRFSVGIESGSDYIRNEVIGKHLSMERILQFNELIKGYRNLYVKAFFLIGFPEETKETLKDTYQLLERLHVHKVGIYYVIPYPGTKLFSQCFEEGKLTVPQESLWSFEGFDLDMERPCIKPDALAIEDLIEFRNKAYALIRERGMNKGR